MSTVEHMVPSVNVRYLFFYNLPEDYNKGYTMRVLREGFNATAKAIPLLSAEILFDTGSPQIGKRKIQPGTATYLSEADYRRNAASPFPWTYDELKQKGFPTEPLTEELFVPPFALIPDLTRPQPVFGVQANFLEGGLCLGFSFSHGKFDARALYEIMKVWSQNCRDIQAALPPSIVSVDPTVFDNEIMTRGHADGRKVTSHPHYMVTETPSIPAGFLRQNFRTRVYYFSPEKLAQLKSDATPQNSWVSTNDALSALIWSSVVATQVDRSNLARPSYNTICVDGRLRASPPLPLNHIGSTMMMVTPNVPLETVLARDLRAVALVIRQTLAGVDGAYVDDLVAFHNSMPDYNCVRPPSLDGFMDDSIFMTTWQTIPFFEVGWGAFMGEGLEAIRTLRQGYFNGAVMTVPTAGDNGVEVIVGMEEKYLEPFDRDEVWAKYAVNMEKRG